MVLCSAARSAICFSLLRGIIAPVGLFGLLIISILVPGVKRDRRVSMLADQLVDGSSFQREMEAPRDLGTV